MNKILSISMIIILFSAFPLYQLHALSSATTKNFRVESIEMNRYMQFEIKGYVEVYNPSLIHITIKQINYKATIKGEEVFTGTFAGATIGSKQVVQYQFANQIDWVPDKETLQEILKGEDVVLTIEATTDASYLYFFTLSGDKTINVSITKHVKPYIENIIAAMTERITHSLSNTL